MKPTLSRNSVDAFNRVESVGRSLPDVESSIRYDGSPVLKVRGCFLAGLATHPSAEPDSLVVRVGFDERVWLLSDAPETYYVTEYYRPFPIVLVRLFAGRPRRAARSAVRVVAASSGKSRQTSLAPTLVPVHARSSISHSVATIL